MLQLRRTACISSCFLALNCRPTIEIEISLVQVAKACWAEVGSGERSILKVSSFDYDIIFSNTDDPKMLEILKNSSLVPKGGAKRSKR